MSDKMEYAKGWREAIEAATAVAEQYATTRELHERLRPETVCYVIRDAIRALLSEGSGTKEAQP